MKNFLSKIFSFILILNLVLFTSVLVDATPVYAAVTDEVKTSGSSWTVPAGVTSVKIWVIGAGGGGGGGTAGAGTGGGAGGVAYKTYTVSPGNTVTLSIGTAGAGGTSAVAAASGSNGGDTTATYGGVTITGNGGTGGGADANLDVNGGSFSGGDGGSSGGNGKGVGSAGDTGGGGGGGIGGVIGIPQSGGAGGNGGQAADVSGLFAAVTAAGYSSTGPGAGHDSTNGGINNNPGGAATGFGSGGGGAGWWGGNGGAGLFGGGGGGAATEGGNTVGGDGGAGAVVFEYSASIARVSSLFSFFSGKFRLLGGALHFGPYDHEYLDAVFSASSNAASYTGLTTVGGMRDGNYLSTNSIHATQIGTNQYIMADLGGSRYVTKVILAPTDPASGFDATYLSTRVLEGSNDNSSYTTIVSSITTVGASTPFGIPVGAKYRYLRVRVPFSNAVAMGDFRIFAVY